MVHAKSANGLQYRDQVGSSASQNVLIPLRPCLITAFFRNSKALQAAESFSKNIRRDTFGARFEIGEPAFAQEEIPDHQ